MIKETLDILAGTNSGIYNDFKKHEAGTALDKYKLTYESLENEKTLWITKTQANNLLRALRPDLFRRKVSGLLFKRATNRSSDRKVEK